MAPLSALPGVTYAVRVQEELEIDMSWASSRLEGNSYDHLDTERLVRFAKATKGRPRRDTVMILNHKDAIRYVVGNLDAIEVSAWDLRNIHALLADQLISDPARLGGLRRLPVAIGRSTYSPPEDEPTIREEFTRSAVRCCVLDWQRFRARQIVRLMDEAGIPTEDRDSLLDHIRLCFRALTETNAVLYGLGPGDLVGLDPSDSP